MKRKTLVKAERLLGKIVRGLPDNWRLQCDAIAAFNSSLARYRRKAFTRMRARSVKRKTLEAIALQSKMRA